jgi:predicted nucleotide-binding protein
MRECNCAIINISADEREKTDGGTYRVNQNVLIEIGAAYLAYNQKVILLTDKRVPLPSNLQGLYRLEYEGDELTWTAGLKLQKALTGFRKSQ